MRHALLMQESYNQMVFLEGTSCRGTVSGHRIDCLMGIHINEPTFFDILYHYISYYYLSRITYILSLIDFSLG